MLCAGCVRRFLELRYESISSVFCAANNGKNGAGFKKMYVFTCAADMACPHDS